MAMKIKRKGAYGHGDDLAWHQNHSSQIVAIAAEAALIHGTPVEDTIRNHAGDIHDFMLRTKVPRSSRLMLERPGAPAEQLQNITRYYMSQSVGSGSLVKVMPPTPQQLEKNPEAPERRIGVNVGCTVIPCNDLPRGDAWMAGIDYDWYIAEARKLVDPLM